MNDCKNCKYTDEYCASGDCNKIQANNIACNEISLTEQWKKGELPEGWYWVKDDDGQIKLAEYSVYCIDRETNETEYDWSCLYEIEQVLAEVPDYIDWRNMLNCACEEHEANHRLLEENAQLKELLKECLEVLEMVQGETIYFPRTVDECIDKINEVLK